jgi:hypothetical protein
MEVGTILKSRNGKQKRLNNEHSLVPISRQVNFDAAFLIMPKVGIEPTLPKEHEFESCASASSATSAFRFCAAGTSISKDAVAVKIGSS